MRLTLGSSCRLLLAGLVFAIAGPAAAAFVTADYLQLEPGNEWTFLENGADVSMDRVLLAPEIVGGASTWVIEGVGGGETSRQNFTVGMDGIALHKIDLPGGSGTATFDTPLTVLDAMLEVGQVIDSESAGELAIPGLGTFDFFLEYEATVDRLETVTVPYLDFEPIQALKVSSMLRGTASAGTQDIVIEIKGTDWYALNIGLVMSTSDGDVSELTGTNVPEPTSAWLLGAGLIALAAERRRSNV